jgi:hypothetical protein
MMRFLIALTIMLISVFGTGGALWRAEAHGVRVVVPAPVVVAPPAPVGVAPAPVVVGPPVVVAPGAPIYFYGSRYYSFYRGGWFVTPGYGTSWAPIAVARVPRPIVVAPGFHAHRVHSPGPHGGHGHGHR